MPRAKCMVSKEFFVAPLWEEVHVVQVIKKVNNNVAVCLDDNGRELIAFGRGIGFPSMPYELPSLDKIERTFYDISPEYMGMLQTLPSDVVEFTSAVVDMARGTLPYPLSPNLLLTLSDHIAFAIERTRKGIYVKMPLAYDLEQMYPQEIALARKTVDSIQARFKIRLPKDEASGIAMAFINARVYSESEPDTQAMADGEAILDAITHIIEQEMGVDIDTTTFNYTRYATHVQYLLERLHSGKGIDSINQDIYISLREEYPDATACVDKIAHYLHAQHGFDVTEEEQLYLILHVNRVCANRGL